MVNVYYHTACVQPVLSVSSVAGSDFMDGTCVMVQCVPDALRRGKGFLYEWPLAKTVVKLWLIVFVERITFHFTDIFSLSEMLKLATIISYNFTYHRQGIDSLR